MKIKKHIPNILSSVRLLSPFVLTPVIMSGSYLLAIILLSGFLLTDAIDGFLARKWNVQSDLGVKLDAVADKIIVLEKGECMGIGTHKELLENCKTYQEIAYSQLSKEELNG